MKIVIITSSTKALFNLRKELVGSWVDAGHMVTALGDGSIEEYGTLCNAAGYEYRQITLSRNGINPLYDIKTLQEIQKILDEIKPDRVFCTFAKAISYGAWAARRVGIKGVYALVSGLGSIFHGKSMKEKLVAVVMSQLYKNAFRGCSKVIFQNNDDLNTLVGKGLLPREKGVIVNGSGVDLDRFEARPLPQTNTFLFVGRLLREKGIREYIKAAETVKKVYPNSHFLVVGDIDTNPSSLKEEEVRKYKEDGVLEFLGFKDDVRPYLKLADIFVLPSYHEGTPRCVLEAMAMGRPVLTSDAPGCRETVENGENGFLIEVGDWNKLAEKMIYYIENPEIAVKHGKKARQIAENKYDVNLVNSDIARIMHLNR